MSFVKQFDDVTPSSSKAIFDLKYKEEYDDIGFSWNSSFDPDTSLGFISYYSYLLDNSIAFKVLMEDQIPGSAAPAYEVHLEMERIAVTHCGKIKRISKIKDDLMNRIDVDLLCPQYAGAACIFEKQFSLNYFLKKFDKMFFSMLDFVATQKARDGRHLINNLHCILSESSATITYLISNPCNRIFLEELSVKNFFEGTSSTGNIYMGGIDILMSDACPKNKIYFLPHKDYNGVIPIRNGSIGMGVLGGARIFKTVL